MLQNTKKPNINTFTSVTYSCSKQDDEPEVRTIEYKSTVEDKATDHMMSTSYTSVIKNDSTSESFNKLLKQEHEVYEQVGHSHNKTDWSVKEFHNQNLDKEYKDDYDKHKFDNCITLATQNSHLLLN